MTTTKTTSTLTARLESGWSARKRKSQALATNRAINKKRKKISKNGSLVMSFILPAIHEFIWCYLLSFAIANKARANECVVQTTIKDAALILRMLHASKSGRTYPKGQ